MQLFVWIEVRQTPADIPGGNRLEIMCGTTLYFSVGIMNLVVSSQAKPQHSSMFHEYGPLSFDWSDALFRIRWPEDKHRFADH
jgi:hypothetical protein